MPRQAASEKWPGSGQEMSRKCPGGRLEELADEGGGEVEAEGLVLLRHVLACQATSDGITTTTSNNNNNDNLCLVLACTSTNDGITA